MAQVAMRNNKRHESLFTLVLCLQDVTAEPVAKLGKGCVYNQRVPDILTEAGLVPISSQTFLGGVIVMVEAKQAGT